MASLGGEHIERHQPDADTDRDVCHVERGPVIRDTPIVNDLENPAIHRLDPAGAVVDEVNHTAANDAIAQVAASSTEPKRSSASAAAGATDGTDAAGSDDANGKGASDGAEASSASGSTPSVGGVGGGGSPFMIWGRVPTLARGKRPACSV